MEKIFREEHVGQPVYTSKFGTGTIIKVGKGLYPVEVLYARNSHTKIYTQDGRNTVDTAPVLSFGTSHCYGEPTYPVKYTRVGEVSATPMTRKEYNMYRGWELPDNENGDDEGYLIRYLIDKDYAQWQPKELFHKLHLRTV